MLVIPTLEFKLENASHMEVLRRELLAHGIDFERQILLVERKIVLRVGPLSFVLEIPQEKLSESTEEFEKEAKENCKLARELKEFLEKHRWGDKVLWSLCSQRPMSHIGKLYF